MDDEDKTRAIELTTRVCSAVLDHAAALGVAVRDGDSQEIADRTGGTANAVEMAYAELMDIFNRRPDLLDDDELQPIWLRLRAAQDQFLAACDRYGWRRNSSPSPE